MDNYQLAEQRGRTKTSKRFKNLQIVFTTDKMDKVDFYATGLTFNHSGDTYVGEIKNYDDPNYHRSFKKFKNYMIDYWKLSYLITIAKAEGRTPLLIVYFDDYTIVWDISNIDIDSRRKWDWVNKDGQDYGKKEYALMTYLYESEILWKETRQDTELRMKLLS